MDSGQSRPPSPDQDGPIRRQRPRLVDPASLTPDHIDRRPTVEQNVAFAELQQSQDAEMDDDRSEGEESVV